MTADSPTDQFIRGERKLKEAYAGTDDKLYTLETDYWQGTHCPSSTFFLLT